MKIGPVYLAPLHIWHPNHWRVWLGDGPFYVFRNLPHLIPGRWGFGFFGLIEFGSRNPGSKFGTWLKRVGLWPW